MSVGFMGSGGAGRLGRSSQWGVECGQVEHRAALIDLERPFFHMGVDLIGAMRSESRTHELGSDELADVLRRTRAGFHRAVAAMVSAGNDIIIRSRTRHRR
ncbi:hypothetical protein [Nocardia salmonicida]|uniref:phosphotransferase-like protein n=1 Tax=Nocardia salmonicida TaxID=53431 RepID=UPI003868E7FB